MFLPMELLQAVLMPSILPWMDAAALDQVADNTEMLKMPGKDTVVSIVSNEGSSHKHMGLPKVSG